MAVSDLLSEAVWDIEEYCGDTLAERTQVRKLLWLMDAMRARLDFGIPIPLLDSQIERALSGISLEQCEEREQESAVLAE